MRLFSWNLHSDPILLRRAIRFLAAEPFAVACLQEVPGHLDDVYLALLGSGGRIQVKAQYHSGKYRRRLAILATHGVRGTKPRLDPEAKLIAVTLMLPGLGLVDVVNIHAISRVTENNERNRWKRAMSLRRALDNVWISTRMIAMGDLNAEPFEAEIWDDHGFYGVRDLPVSPAWGVMGAGPMRPLINLAWDVLRHAPDELSPSGTHRYDREHRHSNWYCLDHILVSPELKDYTHGCKVLYRLEPDSSLLQSHGAGGVRPSYGDHLPITANLIPIAARRR